jgi:hypothetical protein
MAICIIYSPLSTLIGHTFADETPKNLNESAAHPPTRVDARTRGFSSSLEGSADCHDSYHHYCPLGPSPPPRHPDPPLTPIAPRTLLRNRAPPGDAISGKGRSSSPRCKAIPRRMISRRLEPRVGRGEPSDLSLDPSPFPPLSPCEGRNRCTQRDWTMDCGLRPALQGHINPSQRQFHH